MNQQKGFKRRVRSGELPQRRVEGSSDTPFPFCWEPCGSLDLPWALIQYFTPLSLAIMFLGFKYQSCWLTPAIWLSFLTSMLPCCASPWKLWDLTVLTLTPFSKQTPFNPGGTVRRGVVGGAGGDTELPCLCLSSCTAWDPEVAVTEKEQTSALFQTHHARSPMCSLFRKVVAKTILGFYSLHTWLCVVWV